MKLEKTFNLTVKQEYLNAIPRPTNEEYKSLEFSIRSRGQQDPVICNKDKVILDGHTRFEICSSLGKETIYRIKDCISDVEEMQYVVESNINRRQLSAFQKIEAFKYILEIFQTRAKENLKSAAKLRFNYLDSVPYSRGGSVVQYANLIGVGQKRVQSALYILKNGSPEIISKCRNGTITINMAYNIITKRKEEFIHPSKYNRNETFKCPHCFGLVKKKELVKLG